MGRVLRPATSLADFVRDPFDAYVSRPGFVFWQRGAHLNGVHVSGVLGTDVVDELFEAFSVDVHPRAEPHVSIVDFGGVTYTDLATMVHFVSRLNARIAEFAAKVRARLILHPPGELAIAIAGVRVLVPDLYPVRMANELAPHLAWLGIAVDDPILAWLESEVASGTAASPSTIALVRRVLEQRAEVRTLTACARHLGVSSRALQRGLQQGGTTFRDELSAHRIRQAKALLQGGVKVAAVATQLGFSSPQHFSTAFRRATGHTPDGFRRQPPANGSAVAVEGDPLLAARGG